MCRPVKQVTLLLGCILSFVQGESWLFGPCRNLANVDEDIVDWKREITLTQCLDQCSQKTGLNLPQFALWKNSHECYCISENETKRVSGLIGNCFKERFKDAHLYEPRHYYYILLLRYLKIKRLVLDATLENIINASTAELVVRLRAVCLVRIPRIQQDLYQRLSVAAYWFFNGISVHVDYRIPLPLAGNRRMYPIVSTWNATLNSTTDGFIRVVFSTGVATKSIDRNLKFLTGLEKDVQIEIKSQRTPQCQLPEFEKHLATLKVYAGDEIILNWKVLFHAPIFTYEWKFSDGHNVTHRSLEPISSIVHKFEEGVHEINLKVSSSSGNIHRSISLVALDEIYFTLQKKTPLTTIVGSHAELEVSLFITDIKKQKAELHCNGIQKMSAIFSPAIAQTLCIASNYTFIWKFNHSGHHRCRFCFTGDKTIHFTKVIYYDVYHKLERLIIKTKSEVRTNETFYSNLNVFPNLSFTNTTVIWKIFNETDNSNSYVRSPSKFSKAFVFGKPGRYIIKAIVSNPVSKVESETSIIVQDSISGLTVKPSNPTLFTKQNSRIPFHCQYTTGTDVKCAWTISCHFLDVRKQSSFEVIECSFVQDFLLPGSCRISLVVSNKVTSIRLPKPWNVFVENPITHFQVSSPKFATTGSSFPVDVFVPNVHHGTVMISNAKAVFDAGTSVKFATIRSSMQVDVFVPNVQHEAGTIMISNAKAVFDAGSSVYRFEVALGTRTGLHWIRVRASNNVSRVVERWPIEVVAEVGEISVQNVGCLVVGHSAMFLVQIDGQVPSGNVHFLYKWHFQTTSFMSTTYSSVPIIQTDVLTSSENLVVTVFVSNEVSERNSSISVDIPENILQTCLRHDPIVELNTPLELTLLGLLNSFKTQNLTMKLLLTKNKRSFFVTPQRIMDTSTLTDIRWRYVSQSSGFHSIMAQVFSEDSNFISPNLCFHSGFHAQQRLISVKLSGPQTLQISRIPLTHEWHAKVTPDSHGSLFAWSLEDFQSISTHEKLTIQHSLHPGTHELKLRVWNSFSHLDASMLLQAAVTLIAVNYTFTNFLIGRSGTFSITFNQNDPPEDIFIDFGDGNVFRSREHPSSFHHEDLGNGTSIVEVSHVYRTSSGLHTVYFNASNSVSNFEKWTAVYVGVPVSGVKVELLTSRVVPLFEDVLVLCSVKAGSGVGFEWDFGDGTDGQYTMVNSTSNSSLANHSYGVADIYNVTVRIFNNFESTAAHLNVSIQAVEPIEKLHLRPRMEQYAAPLFERKPEASNGSFPCSTDVIVFEAWVWRGSDIHFLFDFGDGQTASVPSELNVWSLPCATVKHLYYSEGAYQVSVTASNPLDSVNQTLQQLFYVQFLPEDLMLDRQYYIIQYMMILSIHASISQGTNVSYNWILGNDQLRETGNSLVLPNLRPGIHIVSAEAHNKVTDFAYKNVMRPTVSSKIYVQERLQEIRLCLVYDSKENCSADAIELPLDTEFKFVAKVLPPTERSLRFTWQLGVTELKRSNAPIMQYQYQSPGRFLINVTAQNHISSVSSHPLVLHLIQKIANLTSIHCQGPNLVRRLITFRALYWFGTNLTFQWDFGDGSPVIITNSSSVQHTYNEVGEYWISVNVWNKFSHANFTSNMFFLHRLCLKPEISFLYQKDRICSYVDDILIEAEISTHCETSNIKYTWVVESVENGSVVNFDPADVLLQRYLIIPKFYLQPGRYSISLKVEMVGFIVYAESSATIEVQFPNIIGFIKGGYLRLMGKNDTIKLEASLLNIENRLLTKSYTWSCSPLIQKHLPCFQDSIPDAFSSTEMDNFYLSAFSLNPRLSAVVINLTIGDGQLTPHTSSQIIELQSAPHVLLIDIECDSCHYHEVNQAAKIQVKATCQNCLSHNIEYEWKIWMIEEGKHRMHFSNYKCVQADGSTFFIVAPNSTLLLPAINNTYVMPDIFPDDVERSHSSSSNQLTSDDLPPFPDLPGFPEDSNSTTVLARHRSVRDAPQDFEDDLPNFFPYQQYPFEEEAHYDENSTLFNLSYPDFLPFPLHDPILGSPDYPIPEEGLPGESGSAVARDQSAQRFKVYLSENEDDIEEGAGKPRVDGNNVYVHTPTQIGDPVRDSTMQQRPSVPHLLNRPRVALTLDNTNSTTGFNSEYFIVKPGVLRVGNSYLVEVNVKDKDTNLKGSAMEFFKVNTGPVNGRCTLMPVKGYSLNFNFRLHCLEWKSENQPLYYELRYSLTHDDRGHLIYFGLNRNVKFVLPSGYGSVSSNVYLNVIITDNLGSSTKVCSLIREVEPLPMNCTLLQYVYNETFHSDSQLARYLNEKQNQALFHRIHILSVSLNNYFSTKGISSKDKILKEQIRFRFLELIENVKILSRAEAVQALSCLIEIIADVSEITMFDVQKVYNIYVKFFDLRSELSGYRFEDLQYEFMALLSRLIYSAHSSHLHNEELIRIGRDRFLTEIKEILEMRLKIEEPIAVEVPHTFISALYLSSLKQSHNPHFLPLKSAEVQLLDNFNLISRNAEKRIKKCPGKDCDNCTAMIAQEFDYVSMPLYVNFVQQFPSKKSSVLLTFLNCDNLENIHKTTSLNFTVKFARNKDYQVRNSSRKTLLQKNYAHVHQINVTDDDVGHSLVFHIFLGNKMNVSEHSYQVEVMFRYGSWPTPRKYSWKEKFPVDAKEHSFFIHRDYIKVPGMYYFVLWTYFDDNSVSTHDIFGEYNLIVWKDVCLGKAHGMWSTHACYSLETSDSRWTDCNCGAQEITAFSIPIHYTTFIVPAKDLMEPYFNVLPLVTFIFISIAYFLLLVLNAKRDGVRNLSCTPVPLMDNNVTHKQLYMICVKTGMYFSSGTTASVFVVLHGTKGMTETRQLIDSKAVKFSFQKGSVDLFLLSTEENLGPLIKLEVWHNNYGSSPSWYLKDITVKDLKTDCSYKFNCCKWISAEKGDGQIEKELAVCDTTPSFCSVLLDNFITYIHDFNIWNSVICGSPASFFTGVQRITCCLGFYMNCAFLSLILQEIFGKPVKDYNLPYISESTLPTSLLISAIATVPQALFTALFRFSKAPELSISPKFSRLFCSLSPRHLYCWFRHKRSNSSRSTAGSTSSMEGSDSLYSSFEESSIMSLPELMEESFSTEEKEEFPTSVSSTSINDPVSPLQNTLSTWQAFENWVRKKHDLITRSDIGRHQISIESSNVHISTEKSDSVLIPEEILLEDLQFREANVNRNLNEHQSNILASSTDENIRQGVMFNRKDIIRSLATLNNDLNTCLHLPFLHPFFYYLAWCLAIVNILVSSIYSFMKVFSFSSLECTLWLKHSFLAIFCSFSIITPFIVLLLSIATTLRIHFRRKTPKLLSSDDLSATETVISEVCKADPTCRRMEYFKKYLRPPKEQVLEQFRQFIMKENRIFNFQSYMWQYILMLLLLMVLSLPQDTKTRYLQRTSIYNAFFRTSDPSKWSKSLHPTLELRDWFETDFMDGLFGGRENFNENSEYGILFSTGCMLVGNAAIRLFKTPHCSQNIFPRNCQPSISSNQSFSFSSYSYEQRKLHGYYGIYNFEDKLVLLCNKEHEAEEQIEIFALNLMDMKFSAVSLEFLLYNPSSSTLFSVSFLFEVGEVGVLFTDEILPVKLKDGFALFYNVNFYLHFVFLFVILIKMKRLGWHILKYGVSYFKNGWNLFSTSFDIISVIYLIVYMFYMIHFEIILSKMKETRFNSNINVMFVAYFEGASCHILTLIFFLHLIKSLRLLYFSQRLKELLNRIISSLKIILLVFAVFLILVFICDIMTRNFVGVTNKLSHPFLNCLKAMQSLLKGYRKPEIINNDHTINTLFSTFILILIISLHIFVLAFLRSILIKSRTTKLNPNKKISFKDTKKVIKRKLTQYFDKQHPKVVDNEDYQLPIEFLLTELEQLADTLLTKAENLFLEQKSSENSIVEDAAVCSSTLDEDFNYPILETDATQVPEITNVDDHLQNWNLALDSISQEMAAQVAERLNATMPRQSRPKTSSFLPSSLNTSLGSQRKFKNQGRNVSLSASLSHKIRKTYPLCHVDSESSSSSEENPVGGAALRKTKSRGKGKKNDLNLTILDDSFL